MLVGIEAGGGLPAGSKFWWVPGYLLPTRQQMWVRRSFIDDNLLVQVPKI